MNDLINRPSSLEIAPAETLCNVCSVRAQCPSTATDDGNGLEVQRRIKLVRGQVLYQPGDPARGLIYAVHYGSVKLSSQDDEGQLRVTRFQMSGELLGLEAMGSAQHLHQAMALEDAEVCEMSYAGRPQALPFLHRMLSKQIALELNIGRQLRHTGTEQRLAEFLLSLGRKHGVRGYSMVRFRLAMSRNDIASFLGLTPESVSRGMLQFKNLGLLAVQGRNVHLLDSAALERIGSGAALDDLPDTRRRL